MDIDKETQKKIQELQILEHNLHSLMIQKQAFQLELNETLNASEEVNKTNDDVYKVTGSIMHKVDKVSVLKELEEKRNILELRLKAIEKQERLLELRAKELQEEAKKTLKSKK